MVRVVTATGDFIAVGHYQNGSIAVRVLSFSDVCIDEDYWTSRLSSALQMRLAIGLEQRTDASANQPTRNNTYRLVHGEGDHLPGLIIDVYGETAVMQAHSVGMHLSRHDIARALMQVSFVEPENGFMIGGSDENTAMENGLLFHVDWLKGQKTGFFVDQRENRALLERYAQGKRVLNMFCYTGGFSFYAMRGGAQLVHSVDSSALLHGRILLLCHAWRGTVGSLSRQFGQGHRTDQGERGAKLPGRHAPSGFL